MAEWFQLERDSVMLSAVCWLPGAVVHCGRRALSALECKGSSHSHQPAVGTLCHGQALSQLQLRKEDCGSEVR